MDHIRVTSKRGNTVMTQFLDKLFFALLNKNFLLILNYKLARLGHSDTFILKANWPIVVLFLQSLKEIENLARQTLKLEQSLCWKLKIKADQ